MFSSLVKKILVGLAVVLGFSSWGNTNAYGLGGWSLFHHHRCCPNIDRGCCDSGDCRGHGFLSRIFHGHCGHRTGSRCTRHRSGCCGHFSTVRIDRGFAAVGLRPIGVGIKVRISARHFAHPQGSVKRRRLLRPLLPPAGTLGWTYRKPSSPVPDHEHPRTGMLTVYNIPAGCSPNVDRMEGNCGIDGVWHFKTIRPLMPGVPHIYNVRFTVLKKGVLVNDVRVVRLIPGRIVDLSY